MAQDTNLQANDSGLVARNRINANAQDAEDRLGILEVSVQEDIIQAAKSSPIAPSGRVYVGGLLTTVNYTDTVPFSNQSTTFAYTNTLLTTKTHVFTYATQVWTTTSNYTYVNGILDGSNIATVIV
jgi:hypothetical protein